MRSIAISTKATVTTTVTAMITVAVGNDSDGAAERSLVDVASPMREENACTGRLYIRLLKETSRLLLKTGCVLCYRPWLLQFTPRAYMAELTILYSCQSSQLVVFRQHHTRLRYSV